MCLWVSFVHTLWGCQGPCVSLVAPLWVVWGKSGGFSVSLSAHPSPGMSVTLLSSSCSGLGALLDEGWALLLPLLVPSLPREQLAGRELLFLPPTLLLLLSAGVYPHPAPHPTFHPAAGAHLALLPGAVWAPQHLLLGVEGAVPELRDAPGAGGSCWELQSPHHCTALTGNK